MTLPRGVSGARVVRVLSRLGYEVVRQKGSHVRLKHPGPPGHAITIPDHKELKLGTLHAIVTEVAEMRSMPLEELADML